MLLAPMSKARGGSLFYRLVWSIGNNPLRILEVLQYLLLGWVIIQSLVGFGGFPAYGLPMIGVSKSLIALGLVHIVVMLLRPKSPSFHWILIVPLPFLAYCLFHWLYLSPFRWNAAPGFLVGLQAYGIYLITFNSVYSMRTARWMLILLQFPVLLAVIVAFLRHYVFPDWIQDGSRISDPDYAHGAGGFFQDPANLASLLLLLLPLMLIFIAKYRSNGPVRLYAITMIAILLMGLAMSSNALGMSLVPVMLVVVPFMISDKWRIRKTFWKWSAVIVPSGVFLMYLLMGLAFDRVREVLLIHQDTIGEASRTAAISAFREGPLTGVGLGGFSLSWDRFTPLADSASRHAVGSYHEVLAETGLVGTLLFGISALVFLSWVLREWSAIPFVRVDQDLAHRLKSIPENHPLHRRLRREKGRMSTRKAVIGGLWLGVCSVLLYSIRDFGLKLPVIIFYLSLTGGLLAAFCRGFENQNKGRMRVISASLPLILVTVAGAAAARFHYANHIVFNAAEKLALLQADTEQVFHSQRELNAVIAELELATGLVPTHGEAMTLLGTAELLQLSAERDPPEIVAERALETIEQAIDLYPQSWESHFNAAVANYLTGSENAAREHLLKSIELAPLRVEPRALQGSLLLLRDPNSFEAREVLESILEKDPDYSVIRSLLRSSGMQGENQGQRMRTVSSLTRQFHVMPPAPNRVNAAGLMRPGKPIMKKPPTETGPQGARSN